LKEKTMKTTAFLRSALSAIALAGMAAGGLVAPATANPAIAVQEQNQSFDIENMTCASCPITVRLAMKKVKGVTSVKVDFDSKTADVSFDPALTNTDEIAKASTNAGYPARVKTDTAE
jgi:periplasmic mercuric ion binding protein